MKSNLIKLIKRLWNHLSDQRKKQFSLLLLMMLLAAVLEVISLGAVLPFIGALTAPETILKYKIIGEILSSLQLEGTKEISLFLTLVFVTTAIVSGISRLILLRISTTLAYACGSDLSIEVYRRTLFQPYSVHVARNSSTVISGITLKVALAVNVLYQLLALVSSVVLLFTSGLTLIFINPMVAIGSSFGFGCCYVILNYFSKNRLHFYSKLIAHEQTQSIKALQEGLGGIRDILLDSTQSLFCNIYEKADRPMRSAKGEIIFLSGRPRFIMESAGMVLIALFAYFLSLKDGGITAFLPVLGALALGAQRMLPALQQAYAAWSNILGDQASLSDTIDLLDQKISPELLLSPPTPFKLKESIHFKDVTFQYVAGSKPVLNSLSFEIPKGARVGFIGATGSGKSTAIDLLMGLLRPNNGSILIDGTLLDDNLIRAWQRSIAHVPQNIYLSDASFAENIAFGVPKNEIDFERVKKASEQAQISKFIDEKPEGYDSFVGERGVRLSGGQRQRIAIARALYKKANVLIFDEATSALDNTTEQSVMDAIDGLDRELTIIIIAHRLTTLKNCDFILELEQGNVKFKGSFQELLQSK